MDASAGSINLADFRYFRPQNLYTDARNVRSILVTDFRSELREPVVLISFESLLGRLSVVAYSFAKKKDSLFILLEILLCWYEIWASGEYPGFHAHTGVHEV